MDFVFKNKNTTTVPVFLFVFDTFEVAHLKSVQSECLYDNIIAKLSCALLPL